MFLILDWKFDGKGTPGCVGKRVASESRAEVQERRWLM